MILIFILLIMIVGLAAKIYLDTNHIKINKIEFYSEKIPSHSAFKIVQISDLHNKVFGNQNDKLVKAVQQLKANIIVITGDLIDRHTYDLNDVFHLIEQLTDRNQKVLFVMGNHEWTNPHVENLRKGLQERAVILLDNDYINISEDGIELNIVGVDLFSRDHRSIKEALTSFPKERYTLLLSHSPGVVDWYDTSAVDLIVSGHTHGGQVRIPFIGALVVPDQGFFPKYDKGVYKLAHDRYLYIDSGLGTSRLPIRFLNQCQLSYISIKGKK